MRIGFVMSTEVGLKTQYLNWRESLSPEMGVEPEWIVIDWRREHGLIERLPLLPRSYKSRIRSILSVRQGLRKGGYDCLFLAATSLLNLPARTLSKIPYFISTDVTPLQLQAFGQLYNKLPSRFAAVEKSKHAARHRLYQNAQAIFPWSQWTARSLVEDYGVDPARVHVIPPGIDLEKWSAPIRPVETATTHILFVGGDFYRKGGDLLLNWARDTASTGWQLHLVTRDKVTSTHPSVHVYNNLSSNDPALVQLYRQSHIFALPTRGDCYSLAGMEALASAMPVLLGRTGGTEDIIQEGKTGFLIDPGDSAILNQRLEYLLAHPEKRAVMGCDARVDAEKRYNIHTNVEQTLSLIRHYLGK